MSSALRDHGNSNIWDEVNSDFGTEASTSNTSTQNDAGGCPSLKSFVPPTQTNNSKPATTTRLHRHGYVLYLTTIYASLAIFAWTIEGVLALRPMTDTSYTVNVNSSYLFYIDVFRGYEGLEHGQEIAEEASNQDWYHNKYGNIKSPLTYAEQQLGASENWYRLVRILGVITSVLVIPVTSAICSKAVVAYLQHNRRHFHLTLRQAITLADKGWTDPQLYGKLLTTSGWKRYGSSFLMTAMLLNLLGAAIPLLQELFVSQLTIKTPVWPNYVINQTDIPELFGEASRFSNSNYVAVLLRGFLTTTSTQEYQP
ncbi:hypothetical protein MMC17_000851 [Xylographa soralifera]|nr:hypothetical protein [Xylographa soralifera]